ncbi:MAG TPA: S41 family peptidase [Candidatus Omnitrophota bacterium]|nr:S41 family peptidase [Candidatus Omnitrophota bacterium]
MVRRICLIFCLCFVLGATLRAAPEPAKEAGKNIVEELKLFAKTMGAIHDAYVGETQLRTLFYSAVQGMLNSLGDKYAQFFDPSTYELLKMHMRGEYAGIGTVLQIADGYPEVVALKPDSPAAKAGVKIKDRILEIDKISVRGQSLAEAAKLLRGEAGTEVQLLVMRPSKRKKITITVQREKIEIESVQDARIIEQGIGYLKIVHFQDHTAKQVESALRELDQQGLRALIIDLRDNDGGILEQAVELADFFLPSGSKVVSVRSKIKEQQRDHATMGKAVSHDVPLVILVNGKSASASEIFSACMQDYERAVVVGSQTYGKASVQSVVPLDDKTAMKFTTARYLSPKGRMIDGVGIKPDEVMAATGTVGRDADLQIVKALELLAKKLK